MTLTLKGDVPSKKNSRVIFWRNGRPFSVPSANHKEWHDDNLWLLKRKKAETPCRMHMVFYPSTKRKSDLTNKAESVADLLVDGGVIPDDNWFVVSHIVLSLGEVDKKNPRVEVTLT